MDAYGRSFRFGRGIAAAVLLIAIPVAGCSSDDGDDGGAATTAAPTTTTTLPPSDPLWAAPGTGTLPVADDLQAAIDDWVEYGTLGGVTAAVVTLDGIWSGAAGVDGAGAALQPDAAMSIMSITKTYTAAEVLLLSSEGLIDLDAPITDYIDLPFDDNGATVRQVLAMRSGFPGTEVEPDAALMAADLSHQWTPAEWLAAIAGSEPDGTVGGQPVYNGHNYVALAAVIEAVTGMSYDEAIRTDLLAPAGLDRTWAQPTEAPTAPLTVGGTTPTTSVVDPASAVMPSVSFASALVGAGSLAADAADAAMWGYLLYGGHVIDASLVAQMEADAQTTTTDVDYALGTMVFDFGDVVMVGHAGGGTDYPYTCDMYVVTGDHPVAIAVLAPEAADHGSQIFDLFMRLHDIAAG